MSRKFASSKSGASVKRRSAMTELRDATQKCSIQSSARPEIMPTEIIEIHGEPYERFPVYGYIEVEGVSVWTHLFMACRPI